MRTKDLFFVLGYGVIIFWGLFFITNPLFILLFAFILMGLWKILYGLSWYNFLYLGLFNLEIFILRGFFASWWLGFFTTLFIILFILKLKYPFPKNHFRELFFYWLLFGWWLSSLVVYFGLNYAFFWSLIVFAFGLFIFIRIDHLIFHFSFLKSLIFYLVNLQLFWIFCFLPAGFFGISLLGVLWYWFCRFFLEETRKEKISFNVLKRNFFFVLVIGLLVFLLKI